MNISQILGHAVGNNKLFRLKVFRIQGRNPGGTLIGNLGSNPGSKLSKGSEVNARF